MKNKVSSRSAAKNAADQPSQVSPRETAELLRLLATTARLPGDVVELGCFRGDTSVLFQRALQQFSPRPTLWLYDSFAGLPARTAEDASVAGDNFRAGELFVTKREVIEKFKRAGLPLPIIKKAFFEDLDPASDLPAKIRFGFLDGDLYSSIKTSLRLAAPRVVPGGILVVHDYNNPELPGSARAVDEFLRAHPAVRLARFETLAVLYF